MSRSVSPGTLSDGGSTSAAAAGAHASASAIWDIFRFWRCPRQRGPVRESSKLRGLR